MQPDILLKVMSDVKGFLSYEEAKLLFEMASQVPSGGTIVEVGSFQGRSTVCLGLGAKEAGARVYSIDPHDEYSEGDTHYGMADQAALFKNLLDFEVADIVRVIALPSWGIHDRLIIPLDLLWIDGSHTYDMVMGDLEEWSTHVKQNGKLAIHDTAGHHIDVTRALADFMRDNEQWTIEKQCDAIAVLSRMPTE